jgi:hypothetical protein
MLDSVWAAHSSRHGDKTERSRSPLSQAQNAVAEAGFLWKARAMLLISKADRILANDNHPC